MKNNVIEVKDLYKSFGSLDVLKGVSLNLEKSENLVVLGKSGSGKSVLIKILSGLIKADSGKVRVLGYDLNNINRIEMQVLRQRIGFCFQSSALYDGMTIAENIAFPLKYAVKGMSDKEIMTKTHEMLEAVGLENKKNQMPAELSGGQKKRIGIARTLVTNPEIILYDEPTAGLDPITCVEINELISEVQDRFKTSAIIITHDLTCAKETGDRIAVLLNGVFKQTGSFDEIFNSNPSGEIKMFRDYNFIEKTQIAPKIELQNF